MTKLNTRIPLAKHFLVCDCGPIFISTNLLLNLLQTNRGYFFALLVLSYILLWNLCWCYHLLLYLQQTFKFNKLTLKAMLGKIIGLFELASANASQNDKFFSYIKYAITQEDDQLTPAQQCTSTPPLPIPSFINEIAAGKCLRMLVYELSAILISLQVKSFGNIGLMPAATCSICVIPAYFNECKS